MLRSGGGTGAPGRGGDPDSNGSQRVNPKGQRGFTEGDAGHLQGQRALLDIAGHREVGTSGGAAVTGKDSRASRGLRVSQGEGGGDGGLL